MFIIKRKTGFTYLELMLVLAILTGIAVFSIPLYVGWQSGMILSDNTYNLKTILEMTKARSRAGYNNQTHGVYFQGDNEGIIIFQGSSYNTRLTAYDEEYEFSNSIDFLIEWPEREIVFQKGTGAPSATGTIVVSSQATGESNALYLNNLGIIELD